MQLSSLNFSWRLTAGVHAAIVDDDLVFLDVPRDAYLCLPDAVHDVRFAPDGRLLACEPAMAVELKGAGLIEPGSPEEPDGVARWNAPTRSAMQDHYGNVRLTDGPEIIRSITDTLIGYRGRSFNTIIRRVQQDLRAPPAVTETLLDVVGDFHRWSPYAPVSCKCLLRSFMLLTLIRRHGLDANWVFAVRTWPFEAHCWLQIDDLALDEQPDRIRSFTPIMVV